MAYQRKDTWKYWIPGFGRYLSLKDSIESKNPFAGVLHSLGIKTNYDKELESGLNLEENASTIIGEVKDTSREQFIEDRDHDEMREDTRYQRMVEDMRKAGLNPLMSGASPAATSSTSVGENTIMTRLQTLGYILDLKNLDLKNKQITNQAIGNILKIVK